MKTSEPEKALSEKALQVEEILSKFYGPLKLKPRREPLHELLSTMISHRTTEAQEDKAYHQMMATFGTYEKLMEAPFEQVADSLVAARFPGAKAQNIQKVLRQIKEEHGEITLEFLEKMPVSEALEWLMSLPGVGLKTASLLLLFNFKKPVLPVDTHVFRVSQRIGLLPEKTTAEKAHRQLLALFPPDAVLLYNFHIHLLRHGQKICVWRRPKCEQCPLQTLCNYYLSGMAGKPELGAPA